MATGCHPVGKVDHASHGRGEARDELGVPVALGTQLDQHPLQQLDPVILAEDAGMTIRWYFSTVSGACRLESIGYRVATRVRI